MLKMQPCRALEAINPTVLMSEADHPPQKRQCHHETVAEESDSDEDDNDRGIVAEKNDYEHVVVAMLAAAEDPGPDTVAIARSKVLSACMASLNDIERTLY